jgi:plasmid stabilization system protein ParE
LAAGTYAGTLTLLMMSAFELTPLAEADLFQIWAYIAEDSPSAADRVEEAIYAACRFVAAAPHRGHTRRDLTGLDVRFWPLRRYPNYSIVYRPDTAPLQVVAVLHGKRDLVRVLRGR